MNYDIKRMQIAIGKLGDDPTFVVNPAFWLGLEINSIAPAETLPKHEQNETLENRADEQRKTDPEPDQYGD